MTPLVLIVFGISGWIAAFAAFGLWHEEVRELQHEIACLKGQAKRMAHAWSRRDAADAARGDA